MSTEERLARIEQQLQQLHAELLQRPTADQVEAIRVASIQTVSAIATTFTDAARAMPRVGEGAGLQGRRRHAETVAPEVWSGDKTGKTFREFASSLKNWMTALHPDGVDMMEHAEKAQGPILNEDNHDDWEVLNSELYIRLIASTTGEARTYVQNIPRPEGFHAWNELVRWFDPRGGEDQPGALEKVVSPAIRRARSTDEAARALQEFEGIIRHYQDSYGLMDDATKIVGLKKILPEPLLQKIRGEHYARYQDLRRVVVNYLNDRASEVTHKERRSPDPGQPVPMDIGFTREEEWGDDSLSYMGKGGWFTKGKGGKLMKGDKGAGKGAKGKAGKAWGKGKGKGENRGGKGGAQKGPCWTCGGRGHLASECPTAVMTYGLEDEYGDSHECPGGDHPPIPDVGADELIAAIGLGSLDRIGFLGEDGHLNENEQCDECLFSLESTGPGWVKIEAHVDSGAADNVLAKQLFPAVKLRPSEGSKSHRQFVTASGARLPNMGEKVVGFQTKQGENRRIVFQVTDVTRPLISVKKIMKAGNFVYLDNNPRIVHKATGKITPLVEKNGMHMLEMYVDMSHGPVFTGQGTA